jgi:hypothetical protein
MFQTGGSEDNVGINIAVIDRWYGRILFVIPFQMEDWVIGQ